MSDAFTLGRVTTISPLLLHIYKRAEAYTRDIADSNAYGSHMAVCRIKGEVKTPFISFSSKSRDWIQARHPAPLASNPELDSLPKQEEGLSFSCYETDKCWGSTASGEGRGRKWNRVTSNVKTN